MSDTIKNWPHVTKELSAQLRNLRGGAPEHLPALVAAAFGVITPVQGALFQELIDVAVILNALRALYDRLLHRRRCSGSFFERTGHELPIGPRPIRPDLNQGGRRE